MLKLLDVKVKKNGKKKSSQNLKKTSTRFNVMLSCGPFIKTEQKSVLSKSNWKNKGKFI